MGPAGLTFSLGVPSGFSAFPRKFGEISKVDYEGARNSPKRDIAQGLQDLEKVTPGQGQYRPPAEEDRGNPTPIARTCHPRDDVPSCLKATVSTLPVKGCEHLLVTGGRGTDHTVLLKYPRAFRLVTCSNIETALLGTKRYRARRSQTG